MGTSILQKQVIQSFNELFDDNLLDMIQRFMKPNKIEEKNNDKPVIVIVNDINFCT